MSRQHWLMKSEPFKYPFAQLVRDGQTTWDGIRNYEARNGLRAMKVGDLCLFYHSNEGKSVVGVARVKREAYPDATAPEEDWSVVDVEPVVSLKAAVTLDAIRSEPALSEIYLLKRPRISVVPVSKEHFDRILAMGHTRLAAKSKAEAPAAAGHAAEPTPGAAPVESTQGKPAAASTKQAATTKAATTKRGAATAKRATKRTAKAATTKRTAKTATTKRTAKSTTKRTAKAAKAKPRRKAKTAG